MYKIGKAINVSTRPNFEKIINKDILLLKGSSNSKIKIILSYLNNENLIREIA